MCDSFFWMFLMSDGKKQFKDFFSKCFIVESFTAVNLFHTEFNFCFIQNEAESFLMFLLMSYLQKKVSDDFQACILWNMYIFKNETIIKKVMSLILTFIWTQEGKNKEYRRGKLFNLFNVWMNSSRNENKVNVCKRFRKF